MMVPPAKWAVVSWTRDKSGVRLLRLAGVFYGLVWFIHTADHVRRGTDVVSTPVLVLGALAAVQELLAVGAVFLRWRWAPIAAAAVGLSDAVGIVAVHLLPHWGRFSDAFPGAHGTGVTAVSWVTGIGEMAGALAFGLAGAYVWRRAESLTAAIAP